MLELGGYNPSYNGLCAPFFKAAEMVYICSDDLMQRSARPRHPSPKRRGIVVCVCGGDLIINSLTSSN